MKKWKLLLIAFAALAFFFILLIQGIKASTQFRVTHFAEVKSEVGADGRAAAGSPEVYQIRPSTAYTWEMTKNSTGFWRVAAWVLILAGATFVFLYGNGIISFGAGTSAPSVIVFVILAAAAACMFAAYSSAYDNNYVEVGADQYNAIKDKPQELKGLFDAREYIR